MKSLKMKLKCGDIVTCLNDISCPSLTLLKGTKVQILSLDRIFKTYDIMDVNDSAKWILDVSEKELTV